MRTFVSLLLASTALAVLLPATPAQAVDAQPPCLDCVVIWPSGCVNTIDGGYVCWNVDPLGCTTVAAYVGSHNVQTRPIVLRPTSTTTPGIDVGPVHVSPVTVSTDGMTLVPGVNQSTPSRGVSNTFCSDDAVAALA